jgi:hypothetical protein
VSWLTTDKVVSISVIPRDFVEEVSGMRGYPQAILCIMEIILMSEIERFHPRETLIVLLDFYVVASF